jgi:uncharacterized coiled-coil DUF342 family protein
MIARSRTACILLKTSAEIARLSTIIRLGNMKQYEETGSIPKMTANVPVKKNDADKNRIKDLSDRVDEQQKTIDRMHRDIVRLRTTINNLAARIK